MPFRQCCRLFVGRIFMISLWHNFNDSFGLLMEFDIFSRSIIYSFIHYVSSWGNNVLNFFFGVPRVVRFFASLSLSNSSYFSRDFSRNFRKCALDFNEFHVRAIFIDQLVFLPTQLTFQPSSRFSFESSSSFLPPGP